MSDTMTLFSTAHGYSDLAGGGDPLSPLDGRYRAVAAPLSACSMPTSSTTA